MGVSKLHIFSEDQNRLAELAKAVAHPARVAILEHLAAQQSCICGELVLEIGLSQATVSQHLNALKKAGLIQGTIDGPKVCYCLNPMVCAEALSSLQKLLSSSCSPEGCC